MRLMVNGDTVEVPDGSTVASLLLHLRIDATHVAVERNLDIVPRGTYAQALLSEGDQVEVVTFVGGG
jgi:sulfur carrier protein